MRSWLRAAVVALVLTSGSTATWGTLRVDGTPLQAGDGYRFSRDGWTYVHLQGTPEQMGYQHGYLLKDAIEDNLRVYQVENQHDLGKDWAYFRERGKTVLWPEVPEEYRAELTGIAKGMQARGSKVDVWDVVALNGILELSEYYVPWENAHADAPNPPLAKPQGRCSAFIATGKATKDGKIVMAHSNWSTYAEGERWTVVFDVQPAKGQRMLMDGTPGVITSQDDFGVNASGLMITETTLPQIKGSPLKGVPEFVRSRKAMQYATSIDEYVATMRDGNQGGYANTWLVGDRKTGEVAFVELGITQTPVKRTSDGYFVSTNFAADPTLIREDTTGFDPKNMRSSMNARHKRATAFIEAHLGGIDMAVAEAYLSDHEDSFEHREDPDKRSLCGHEDRSADGEPVWGSKAFAPSGAVTGKVMDAAMAERMSFVARAGHPCGDTFRVEPFLMAHPEYAWQRPILGDMPAGPWTTFRSGETVGGVAGPMAGAQ